MDGARGLYIPQHFREQDVNTLQDFMQTYRFVTLISQDRGEILVSHLPIEFDAQRGPYGTIIGHMALGNPQWRSFGPQQQVLTIFHGPHTYITPSWYDESASVPTWNYAVVHAYGQATIIDDPQQKRAVLAALVKDHEAQFEQPWSLDSAIDYVEQRLAAVVVFEIAITRCEGKFKLSQNRTVAEREHVADQLVQSTDSLAQATGALMQQQTLPPPAEGMGEGDENLK